MAVPTEQELWDLQKDETWMVRLRTQIGVASGVVVRELESVPHHDDRLKWSYGALQSLDQTSNDMFWLVVSDTPVLTKLDDPTTVTATELRSAVDSAIDGWIRAKLLLGKVRA